MPYEEPCQIRVNISKYSLRTNQTISSQEVGYEVFIDVVHQTPSTLIVITSIDEELLPCVFINEWTNLGGEKGAAKISRLKGHYFH